MFTGCALTINSVVIRLYLIDNSCNCCTFKAVLTC